ASTVGVVVDGTAYGSSTSSFPTSYGGLVGKTNNGAPKAYLNWLVFDRNFIFITGGFKQITTTGKEAGTDVPHERIFNTSPITITQPGYVYIYLSNENLTPVEVYFDDFKVTHTKSPVIQTDDYYPFGLTFNSYQRENGLANKFVKFQGQEHFDDLGLNWDSFKWRNHQPDIGRFFNVDPLAEKYYYNSPYAFSENKVIAHVELEGLESVFAADGNIIANGPYNQKTVFDKRIQYTNGKNMGVGLPFQKETVNLKSGWLSQSILPNPSEACYRASKMILGYAGVDGGGRENLFQVAIETAENTAILPTKQAQEGTEYLDAQLEKGNLVLVGVDHTLGKANKNGDNTTDHFVVIDGRFYDQEKQQNYYRFNEVGTRDESKAKSQNNRLYLNKDGLITGKDHKSRQLTVSQIRRNNNEKD
ncbi:MAG TPA: RHS repeat-associated core domain-containing protein, partial [Saprospiraceae bacterium]|nr:RHS repeat-associated core domain-containing protein [Saprospiraceae bacterium]